MGKSIHTVESRDVTLRLSGPQIINERSSRVVIGSGRGAGGSFDSLQL